MASMWKPLLAATLAVGRNTRLLTVGSSILAMKAPMTEEEGKWRRYPSGVLEGSFSERGGSSSPGPESRGEAPSCMNTPTPALRFKGPSRGSCWHTSASWEGRRHDAAAPRTIYSRGQRSPRSGTLEETGGTLWGSGPVVSLKHQNKEHQSGLMMMVLNNYGRPSERRSGLFTDGGL